MAEVIARLVGQLGFEVEPEGLKDFNKGLGEAEKGSKAAGVGGIALGNILADVAGAAANAALELAGMGAALAKDVVFGFVESGTEIDRWSKTIGIGVEELQELQFAAKAVAGEEGVDAMNEGLVTLRENLGELQRVGTGPAKDSLGSLGIELADIEKLGAAEQMELIATALSEVGAQEQISISKELLGDDGGRLLTLLQQGGEGIQAMRERARELGVVMDEEAIGKAKETAVAMAEMDAVIEGAGNTVATALAPQITQGAEALTRWIGENDKLIQQDIPAFIDDAVESGAALLTWAIETGEEFQYLGTQIVIVAESLEETLVGAYETAEPVISFVSDVIDEQVVALGNVLEFIESMVGRLESARAIVGEIQAGLGLDDTQTTDVRGAPKLASEGKTQLRSVHSLSRSELEGALLQPGLNAKTRNQILAQLPTAASKEASEAAAAANAARQLVEEGTAGIQAGLDAGRATSARRKRGEKFRREELSEGGGGGTNTREAKRLLGPEIERLVEQAGLGRAATKAALVAAANALKGGAAPEVARAAAISRIEGLSGQKTAQGPDAALFGMLSKTIGAENARSATAGARLVNIDQSTNITVQVDATIPPEFANAVTTDAQQQGLAAMVQRALAAEYGRVVAHMGPGNVGP